LVISTTDPKPSLLYKSEVIIQNLNPTWNEFDIDVSAVGGLDKEILIECYDWVRIPTTVADTTKDEDGGNDFIGQFKAPLRDLITPSAQFKFINKKHVFFHFLINFRSERAADFL
jgi:Ca2+-dependent lipid-binding protein